MSQVVDLMLASLDDPAQQTLREWLKEYALSRVEESEGWNITEALKKMAEQFLKESFLRKFRDSAGFPEMVSDKKQIEAFYKEMTGLIKAFEEEAQAIGQDGMAWMSRNQVAPDQFFYSNSGPTMVLKPRFSKPRTPLPWAALQRAMQRPQRMHLEVSRMMEGERAS